MSGKKQHILILTSGPLCSNPRPHKEACALAKAGFAVTVLSPRGDAVKTATDERLAAQGGYTQRVLPYDHTIPTRAVTWLLRRAIRLGIEHRRALGPSHGILRAARRIPADLTLVHNEVAHWAGLRLLAEERTVAADIEDWHSMDLLPRDRVYRPLRLLRKHEARLLGEMAYCTTTSEAMAAAMHAQLGGRKAHVITNAFPLPARPAIEERRGPLRFLWVSQTLGPGRGLEPFLTAWARTPIPGIVRLVGRGTEAYKDSLRALVPQGRQTFLEFLAPLPADQLPAFVAQHDIGLALEESDVVNHDLTISNKILQYLGCGVAVLASGTSGQREVLSHGPQAGLVVDLHDTSSMNSAIDELAADRASLCARQLAARHLAETRYNYALEAERLVALVKGALATCKTTT